MRVFRSREIVPDRSGYSKLCNSAIAASANRATHYIIHRVFGKGVRVHQELVRVYFGFSAGPGFREIRRDSRRTYTSTDSVLRRERGGKEWRRVCRNQNRTFCVIRSGTKHMATKHKGTENIGGK